MFLTPQTRGPWVHPHPETPPNQVQLLRIETFKVRPHLREPLFFLFFFYPSFPLLLQRTIYWKHSLSQCSRGDLTRPRLGLDLQLAELMSDWHKESMWDHYGCGAWDLICAPSPPVRDNCLMKAKGVPNPGREGKSEKPLVRAQGLSSGRSAGICNRGSAQESLRQN